MLTVLNMRPHYLLISAIILTACDADFASTPTTTRVSEMEVYSSPDGDLMCSGENLEDVSRQFLTVLQCESPIGASDFFQIPNHDQFTYIFGDSANNRGLIQFSKLDHMDIHILSQFQPAPLVAFYLAEKHDNLTDPEWWESTKFKDYFVCEFTCTRSGWLISSKGSCFEETGNPFND